jgi:hypothetical protein
VLTILAALGVFSVLAISQDVSQDVSISFAAPATEPLDLGQKYLYSLDRIAGPTAWLSYAAGAGIDQLWKKPGSWGDNSESFGDRMASHLGMRLVHENIAFGVRALDHEDPRYFRLGHGNVLNRVKYAAVHTFLVHNDNGSLMPAYSLFVSSYATAAISRAWRPEPLTLGHEAHGGSIGVAVGVVQSLWREFSPDLRHMLPRRFR